MYCPKCGNDLRGDRCSVCGYDRSSDYLLYPTLTPVDPGMSRTDPEEERLRSMYETALAVEQTAVTEAGFTAAALLYEQIGDPGWRDSVRRARLCREMALQLEQQERERRDQELRQLEQLERDRQERDRQEKERQERERREQELRQLEQLERDRQERDRQEKARQERERQEKDRQEQARREWERHQLEQLERDRLERDRKDKERQAAAAKPKPSPQPVSPPSREKTEKKKKKKGRGFLRFLLLAAVIAAVYLWSPWEKDLTPSRTFSPTVTPSFTLRPAAAPTVKPTAPLKITDQVTDSAGLLSASEYRELNTWAAQLSETYAVDMRIIVDVSVTDDEDTQAFADGVLERYDLGYGSQRDCMLLLYFFETGRYYLISEGYGEYVFNDYGLELLINAMQDCMNSGEWYNAFSIYLNECEDFLARAAEGDPVRKES